MTKPIAIKVDVKGNKKVVLVNWEGDTVITKERRCIAENKAPHGARVVVIAEAGNGRGGKFSRRTRKPAFSFSIPKSNSFGGRTRANGSFAI